MHNIALTDNILMLMLPSITSGPFGIATKPIYGSNGVHGIKIVNKIDAKDDEAAQSRNCPSLPLISEGSFTSLVSRRSEKSEKSLEEGQERGNRGNEVSEFESRHYKKELVRSFVRVLLIVIESMLCYNYNLDKS